MERKAYDTILPERVKKICIRTGFEDLFWESLAARRATTPAVSQEEVYEDLEDERIELLGEPLFPSYDAFRQWRNRRHRK